MWWWPHSCQIRSQKFTRAWKRFCKLPHLTHLTKKSKGKERKKHLCKKCSHIGDDGGPLWRSRYTIQVRLTVERKRQQGRAYVHTYVRSLCLEIDDGSALCCHNITKRTVRGAVDLFVVWRGGSWWARKKNVRMDEEAGRKREREWESVLYALSKAYVPMENGRNFTKKCRIGGTPINCNTTQFWKKNWN